MSSIIDRVKKIVAEQLGVKEEEVENESAFVDLMVGQPLRSILFLLALVGGSHTAIP